MYKCVDCIAHDVHCKYCIDRCTVPTFKHIKLWPIDRWHAYKNDESCTQAHLNVPSHTRRLKVVRTSIAEQTFSWFRGYAKPFNEMRTKRHWFIVLYFVARHNQLTDTGDTAYLNKRKASKVLKRPSRSTGYECSKKKRRMK